MRTHVEPVNLWVFGFFFNNKKSAWIARLHGELVLNRTKLDRHLQLTPDFCTRWHSGVLKGLLTLALTRICSPPLTKCPNRDPRSMCNLKTNRRSKANIIKQTQHIDVIKRARRGEQRSTSGVQQYTGKTWVD
jgi:hypothetical protein